MSQHYLDREGLVALILPIKDHKGGLLSISHLETQGKEKRKVKLEDGDKEKNETAVQAATTRTRCLEARSEELRMDHFIIP